MELFEPRSTSLRGNHNNSNSSSNPELFDMIHSNRGGNYYYNNNNNSNGEDIAIGQSTSDIIEDHHHHNHHHQQLFYSPYYPPPSTTMSTSTFPPHQQQCIKWGGGGGGFKGSGKESENGDMKPNINININNNSNNNISVIVPSYVRRQRPSSAPPRCRVEGCKADLSHSKGYHRRHKVCDNHSKAPLVVVNSVEQRFCQQCSRFHLVAEFDDAKRSCRRRLASHNERRRKSTQESMALMSTLDDRRSFDLVVDRNCSYQQLDSAINRAAAASSMNWMKFPLDMSMNMPPYNQGMKDPFNSYSTLHQLPCNSSTTTTSISGGGGYGNNSTFDRLGNGAYTAFNVVKMDPFDQERATDIIMQQQRRRGAGGLVELASSNGGYCSSGAINMMNMQGHSSNYCDDEVEVKKTEEAEEEEEEALTLFDSPFVHEEKGGGQRRRPPCSNSVSEVAPGRALSLLSALQLPPPSSTNTDTTITTSAAATSSTGSCFDLVADTSRQSFSRGFNLNHSYNSNSHSHHHHRHQQLASLVMADPDAPFDSMSHAFDSLHHL